MKTRCPYCDSNRIEQIERLSWVCNKCGETFGEPISTDVYEYHYRLIGEEY